jgi:ABC-type branched-subunit amino acid transport system ATPase component
MLTFENLNAHYGPSHVLQGVDLDVPDGTIAAVLGRNGVGKTTTVRAVMGLVPPSSGRILLDSEDIAGWPPHRVARAGVAYVPEGRLIFPDLTVVENIRVAERRPAKAWPLSRWRRGSHRLPGARGPSEIRSEQGIFRDLTGNSVWLRAKRVEPSRSAPGAIWWAATSR